MANRRYTKPVTYQLGIEHLDDKTATFALGIVESVTGHVSWVMPRDEWERHGRPGLVTVTVDPEASR